MSKDNLSKVLEVELFTGSFDSHIGVSADIEKNFLILSKSQITEMLNT